MSEVDKDKDKAWSPDGVQGNLNPTDEAVSTTETTTNSGVALPIHNAQEVVIIVTLLIAGTLLFTLLGLCLLQFCSSFWKGASEYFQKVRKTCRPPPGPAQTGRKAGNADTTDGKKRSTWQAPACDSALLDLGNEHHLYADNLNEATPLVRGNCVTSHTVEQTDVTSGEVNKTEHENGHISVDIPMSDTLVSRSRKHSSAESGSAETLLTVVQTQTQHEEPAMGTKNNVADDLHRPTRSRISSDLGKIDPSLYEEWRTPNTTALVTTSGRRISVVPRPSNTTNASTSSGGQSINAERGKIYLSIKYESAEAKLIITINRAENLPPRDFSGTVDSYIKVLLLPDRKPKYQTKTQKKTTNPVFDETFSFSTPPDQLSMRTLVISVHDFDRFSRNCLLGSCAIDLSAISCQIKDRPMDFDVQITNARPLEELGDILISLSYLTNVERLTICVMKCQNLKPMDLSGASDPYIKVEVYHAGRCIKKRRTDVKKRSLAPVFNEAFIFDIPLSDMPLVCVIVKAYDYDRLSADELIGLVALGEGCTGPGKAHWLEAIANQRRSIAKWHKLCNMETLKSHLPPFMENVQILSEFSFVKLKDKLHLGRSQSLSPSQNNSPTNDSQSLLPK